MDRKYSKEKVLLEYGLVENNLSAAVSEQVVAVTRSFPVPDHSFPLRGGHGGAGIHTRLCTVLPLNALPSPLR